MTTNEIIEMLENALTGAHVLLETAQNEQTCTPALLKAVSETIEVALHMLSVLKEKSPLVPFADLLNELNDVYCFILSINALEQFNQFTKSEK